ncbi:MAG: CYTH domain-containing protein [Magnetococcales bacterium]|nr:CYTH domain-containing protein [Magnetococcales bacterium]MBF0323294.1 CYTH domain-containing protein [Magnetococcales bacterium]
MGREIERKFLVRGDAWRSLGVGVSYRQGFLSADRERVVRVRIAGGAATLTVKGPTRNFTRAEFDYAIPLEDARFMLDHLCVRPLIEKLRYRIAVGDLLWEVDEFAGENRGLILAEVELTAEDQIVVPPAWIGEEVSGDPRYFNSNLIVHPYCRWQEGCSATGG